MPQAVSKRDCNASTAQQHQSDTCYVKQAAIDVDLGTARVPT